jgi:hypothetical protein
MAEPVRSRPRSWALAAGAIYVPQLVPLATSDLLEHQHCLEQYGRLFPVLVGLPFGLQARVASDLGEPGEEVVLWAVAALTTALLLVVVAQALRRWRRMGPVVAVGVALASTGLALAAVAILRA